MVAATRCLLTRRRPRKEMGPLQKVLTQVAKLSMAANEPALHHLHATVERNLLEAKGDDQ
jgi:hypothetical protein